jgi:hypothetical protein
MVADDDSSSDYGEPDNIYKGPREEMGGVPNNIDEETLLDVDDAEPVVRTARYAEDASVAEPLGPTTKRQGWPGATSGALGVSVQSCQNFTNGVQNKKK